MGRNNSKLSNIQALRGFAAILVIFVHLKNMLSTVGLPIFGGGGIDLFFVISGYIMVYTTCDKKMTATIFFRNRVIRIVPIYWLMTLVVFFTAFVVPQIFQTTSPQPGYLAKSLLFIPFYKSPGHLQPILFVGWTLNYEMFFYAVFSLGLLWISFRQGFLFTVGILAALSLAGAIGLSNNVFFQFYTSPLLLEFAFGMLIGVAFGAGPSFSAAYWKHLWLAAFVASIVALVALPVRGGGGNWSECAARGIPAAIAVTAALGLEQRGDAVKTASVTSLGDASYSMYLTHPFVTQIFEKISARFHTTGAMSVLLIIGCVGSVLLVAQIVHRTIERPVIHVVRRWWGGATKPQHGIA